MDGTLMTEPTAQELADLYPATLHTRWGRSAFMGDPNTIISDDFVCDCDHCFNVRLKKWRKEQGVSSS